MTRQTEIISSNVGFNFYTGNLTFEVYISNKKQGCNEDLKIGRAVRGKGREKCEERCKADENCAFYRYSVNTDNNHNWCLLFPACEDAVNRFIGTTYRKLNVSGLCVSIVLIQSKYLNIKIGLNVL